MFKNIFYIDTPNEIKDKVESFIQEWFNEEEFIQVKTSGSTGTPTVIKLEKKKMEVSAMKTLQFFKIKPNSSALLCLSPDTIAGKMMIVRSIIGKLNLYITSISSNPLVNCNVQIDFAAFVPLQLQQLLIHETDKLKSIGAVIIGGGPISNQLETDLKNKNTTVYHTFGMTETISHVALRKAGKNGDELFHALPGIHFSTLNEKLVIHYPEIGIDEIQTNDLIELTSDTAFKWLGRADFIINTGGVKINPEEEEIKIAHLIPFPFFLAGIQDEKFGQKVVLLIESNEIYNLNKEVFRSVLSAYALPKQLFFIPKFVWTESNKINRIETLKQINKHVLTEVF